MSSNPTEAVPALRLIAAQATKLANDIEAGKLWPGQFQDAMAVIMQAAQDAKP